jgi:hypothetical protein
MAARPIDSTPGLPPTEATGSRGFVGAMYFHLSALNARAFGLTIDMRKVQLNGRLFPLNEVERELQVLFSEIVAAVYQKEANANAAAPHIAALNRLLSAA